MRILAAIIVLIAISLTLPAQAPPSGLPEPAAPPLVPVKFKIDKQLYTSADATRAMAIDASALSQTILAEEMIKIRYFSLAAAPSDQRADYAAEVSLAVNRLSRKPNIVVPAQVGPEGILLRINLDDYDIPVEVWEKIADLSPYFHERFTEKFIRVTEVENTKKIPYQEIVEVHRTNAKGEKLYWPDGKPAMDKKTVTKYKETTDKTTSLQDATKEEIKLGVASWLDPDAMAITIKLTQTRVPIVRADWFIANAMLPPLYYEFLGLKTLEDAKELALFDPRAEKQSEIRATVVQSGTLARRVARNNRILKRVKTANGAWWETFDFKTSVRAQNVIHNFLTTDRDGGEIIFSLPNGLHAYVLVDGKGKLVDEVPIEIATDSLAQDSRVRCGRSCIWCHTKGIQPFKSDFRTQVTAENLIDLGVADKDDPKKTAQLIRFIRQTFEANDFQEIVKIDNVHYDNAVKAASGGRTAASSAASFLRLYDEYAEVMLDPDRLIYESGYPDTDVQAAIKLHIAGKGNGVLLRRIMKPPEPIRRDQFEEVFADFMHRVLAWQQAKRLMGPPLPQPAIGPAKEGRQ